MSFILDALKKSEKERQRSAVPGIGDLPVVVQQARPSTWTIALIAGLGLAVVGLAIAWWRSAVPETVAARDPIAAPARVVAQPRVPPAPVAAQPPAETRSLASEATRVAGVVRPPPPAESPGTTRPVSASPGVITDGPMSITEARLAGMPVPELKLELLVYSGDPARRFVYINSAKYTEGDTLPEGPQLVEITTTGAILSYRGRAYLLPQE
ncbi:MAG TPA: general secretion pathway protein GspB [Gammaproteobacteria bacterium]|nr:general secretion pathway protein GspB [Gammaproteobacteria bacterium]